MDAALQQQQVLQQRRAQREHVDGSRRRARVRLASTRLRVSTQCAAASISRSAATAAQRVGGGIARLEELLSAAWSRARSGPCRTRTRPSRNNSREDEATLENWRCGSLPRAHSACRPRIQRRGEWAHLSQAHALCRPSQRRRGRSREPSRCRRLALLHNSSQTKQTKHARRRTPHGDTPRACNVQTCMRSSRIQPVPGRITSQHVAGAPAAGARAAPAPHAPPAC